MFFVTNKMSINRPDETSVTEWERVPIKKRREMFACCSSNVHLPNQPVSLFSCKDLEKPYKGENSALSEVFQPLFITFIRERR